MLPTLAFCYAKENGKTGALKKHTLAKLTDRPDNLLANFKLLLKREATRRRIESDTMPLQMRVLELPDVRFLKSIH